MVKRKIFLIIIRYRNLLHFFAFPAEAFFLNDVYITDKLALFSNRHIKGCNLLAVTIGQILHDLTIGGIVNVHIGNKDHPRNLVFFTQLPGLFRPHFHAGLTGDDDDGRIRHTHRLLYLSDKIEEAGRIQQIDLAAFPLHRNRRCADGNSTLLLFLIEIADGILIFHPPHSGSQTSQIGHRLCKCRFSATPMSQQNHVADFVSRINVHAMILHPFCYDMQNDPVSNESSRLYQIILLNIYFMHKFFCEKYTETAAMQCFLPISAPAPEENERSSLTPACYLFLHRNKISTSAPFRTA